MTNLRRLRNLVWEKQADATLSQTNPVSGTQYTVLDTVANCRIQGLAAQVTWTVQPSPLEVYVVADGVTMRFAVTNPTSATWYYGVKAHWGTANQQTLITSDYQRECAFYLEGRSIQVLAETTGGTTSNLTCRVKYWLK